MPADTIAAHELELYLDNDRRFSADSPEGIGKAVRESMLRKVRSGRYNSSKAAKGWMPVVDDAAKAYSKEFGGTWHVNFDAPTRRYVAQRMADEFEDNVKTGEYKSNPTKTMWDRYSNPSSN